MKDLKNLNGIRSCSIRDGVWRVVQDHGHLLRPLLFGICLTAYAQSLTAASSADVERCEDPGAALQHTVEVTAGGPYVTRAGVPITLHGSYTVEGQTNTSAHLKTIGQALLSYVQANGSYPPAALLNKHGQATVSWRVLLLPYLGEQELYERFDLQKSWDDPANLHLLREMPEAYRNSDDGERTTETGFAGVQGTGALFNQASKELSGGERPDLLSATEKLAVGPVGSDVHLPWTAPGDVRIERATHLGSAHGFSGKGHALTPLLFLDGSVRLMPDDLAAGNMITWTHIPSMAEMQLKCACAPPSSVDTGLHATWDLGKNGTFNTQGFDVTFLASKPGTYTVTMHVSDRFNNQYESPAKVEVR